jgi:hypothetical protein
LLGEGGYLYKAWNIIFFVPIENYGPYPKAFLFVTLALPMLRDVVWPLLIITPSLGEPI